MMRFAQRLIAFIPTAWRSRKLSAYGSLSRRRCCWNKFNPCSSHEWSLSVLLSETMRNPADTYPPGDHASSEGSSSIQEPLFSGGLSVSFVVVADGRVERARELLHLRGGLDGLSVVGKKDALFTGVHVYALGWDGVSVYDDVLENVARGVVNGFLDPPNFLAR